MWHKNIKLPDSFPKPVLDFLIKGEYWLARHSAEEESQVWSHLTDWVETFPENKRLATTLALEVLAKSGYMESFRNCSEFLLRFSDPCGVIELLINCTEKDSYWGYRLGPQIYSMLKSYLWRVRDEENLRVK